jgi:hypothetical protein
MKIAKSLTARFVLADLRRQRKLAVAEIRRLKSELASEMRDLADINGIIEALAKA